MTRKLTALLVLMTLTACDLAEKYDFRKERNQRAYQEAMADYQAGRLDAALEGFKRAVRADPANSAARFQLGCLLQDARRDYLEAYCCYHEYLSQQPASDKTPLARERSEACLREMAKTLSQRFGVGVAAASGQPVEALRQDLRDLEKREAVLRKELDAARVRGDALAADRDRLMAMIKGEGIEDVSRPKVEDVKDLLNEEDEDLQAVAMMPAAANGVAVTNEVAALKGEKEDTSRSQVQSDLSSLKGHGKPIVKAPKPVADEPKHERRPDQYVVKEGDTLMRLAIRFYGYPGAWRRIRDANKLSISTDGRIRVGDTIKLPKP